MIGRMRMTTHCHAAFWCTVFGLVWIIDSNLIAQDFRIDENGNIIIIEKSSEEKSIPSKEAPSPIDTESSAYRDFEKKRLAFVITKTASAYTEPNTSSPLALQFRQTDRLRVLGEQAEFFKVQYWLEGEFPVEAWILKAQVRVLGAEEALPEAPDNPVYDPRIRTEEVITQVEDVPELAEGQVVQLDEKAVEQTASIRPSKRTPAPKAKPSIRLRETKRTGEPRQGPWDWELDLSLGFSNYEEKVKTQTQASTSLAEFLSSQFEGFHMAAGGAVSYQVHPQVRVGGKALYHFDIMTSSVPSGSTTIDNAGVTAQFHDVGLGPYVEYELSFPSAGIRFSPELWLSGHMQFFDPNQLQDSNRGQSVLFGHLAFYGRALLSPKLEFPYGAHLRPQLALSFLYGFTETPTQVVSRNPDGSVDEVIHTGSPQSTSFALQYGGEIAWSLNALGFQQNEIFFRGFLKNFPKSFSGNGNRAGVRTLNAESSAQKIELSLGYRHLF